MRTSLVLDAPFFGTLALKLEPKASTRTETMATDGVSLFYNPQYVMGLPDAHLLAMYAHEVLHPAMLHHTRREGREPTRWNESGGPRHQSNVGGVGIHAVGRRAP